MAQIERGETRIGTALCCLLYRDHLYLCADEPSRALFLKNPDRYARVASLKPTSSDRACPSSHTLAVSDQPTAGSRPQPPNRDHEHSIAPVPREAQTQPGDATEDTVRR